MNTKNIVIAVIALIVVVGGGFAASSLMKSSPSTSAAASAAATNQAAATSTATQVQAQDEKVGTGDEAKPGTKVSVLYVGKLTDGTVFDSSAQHNNQPITFTLGSQDMIPGFQIGVNGMKVGGQRVMAIPPALAYGDKPVTNPQSGAVIIPANSTIVFEVQLVKVEAGDAAAAAPAPTTKK